MHGEDKMYKILIEKPERKKLLRRQVQMAGY
jgi:hypothetical protein